MVKRTTEPCEQCGEGRSPERGPVRMCFLSLEHLPPDGRINFLAHTDCASLYRAAVRANAQTEANHA